MNAKLEDEIIKRYENLTNNGVRFEGRINYFCDLHYSEVNLEKLAEADDETFLHDMDGIRENMNRETCKLERGFVPRVGFRK